MLQKATVKKLKPITMRYILFVLLYFFVAFFAKGQANTFPSSGNVGIGTSMPSHKLNVSGAAGDSNFGLLAIDANGANASLKLGVNTDYSWIQAHGSPFVVVGN
jgi:hypothetical protein